MPTEKLIGVCCYSDRIEIILKDGTDEVERKHLEEERAKELEALKPDVVKAYGHIGKIQIALANVDDANIADERIRSIIHGLDAALQEACDEAEKSLTKYESTKK